MSPNNPSDQYNRRFRRGLTEVCWHEGAIVVSRGAEALLLDCPSGAAENIGSPLEILVAIALSSGRIEAIGGLPSLLCALQQHRGPAQALPIHFCLGEERAPTLASAWSQAFSGGFPLSFDAEIPGARFAEGEFVVSTCSVVHGEPNWSAKTVERNVGLAMRIDTPEMSLAWVPGAKATPALQQWCSGRDLAIIEVGVRPWPLTKQRWRMTTAEACSIGAGAGEIWLVGDDRLRLETARC